MGDWREKPDKEINQWKTSKLDEEMWEENQKIIDIVNEKTFQPRLRTRNKKPRFVVRGGTWVKEGLGQNKVLFSSQRGWTVHGSIHLNVDSPTLFVSGGQISGHLPASGSVEDQTDSNTFFISSLDALCSVFH